MLSVLPISNLIFIFYLHIYSKLLTSAKLPAKWNSKTAGKSVFRCGHANPSSKRRAPKTASVCWWLWFICHWAHQIAPFCKDLTQMGILLPCVWDETLTYHSSPKPDLIPVVLYVRFCRLTGGSRDTESTPSEDLRLINVCCRFDSQSIKLLHIHNYVIILYFSVFL